MAGHHLDVFVARPAIAVLVLDTSVWEMNVLVEVRQVVFARPPCDLLRLTVRPAVAVLPATVTLLKEPLVVPFELVVEDDATHPRTLVPQALLSAQVSAIDLRVVRELARLPDARVEGLARLLRAVMTAGLEKIATAIGQDDGTVGGTERRRSNQPFMSKVLQTSGGVV
jgi:hypothetical protein